MVVKIPVNGHFVKHVHRNYSHLNRLSPHFSCSLWSSSPRQIIELSCSYVIGWLAIYGNKLLNFLPNKVANDWSFLSSHGNATAFGNLQPNLKAGAKLSELYIITFSPVLERFWEKRFWKTWKQRHAVKRAARMSGTNNNRLRCSDRKQLLHCACCMLFGTKRDYTALFSPSLNIICSRLVTNRRPSFMCFRLLSPSTNITHFILKKEHWSHLKLTSFLRSTRNPITNPALWVFAYLSPPVQHV